MLRGIMPAHARRAPSCDFEIISPPTLPAVAAANQGTGSRGGSNKENEPSVVLGTSLRGHPYGADSSQHRTASSATSKRTASPAQRDPRNVERDVLVENGAMHRAFDQMLDDLQIPNTLRPKLQNLQTPVKAAMVRSSHVLTLNVPPPDTQNITPTATPSKAGTLRRTQSSGSLGTPRPSHPDFIDISKPRSRPTTPTLQSPTPPFASQASFKMFHTRGISLDGPRALSQSQYTLVGASTTKLTKDKAAAALRDLTPAKFATMLANTPSIQLNVERIRKLRIMLRNESASWSESFIIEGGYACLLARLNEILEVEWREEQRDDLILHELLRCFKALSTSSIGCFALRSSCPRPFVQLASLMYSDKRPGDVATRRLIVELFLILFELYPCHAAATPPIAPNSSTATLTNPMQAPFPLPAPHTSTFSLLRALMLTPKPLPSEVLSAPISPHAFIQSLHQPRIYKTYLQELNDVCRDYFWVFCHPNNTIWRLEEVDEAKVEAPKAPGGMTGGVEFEAMGYMTIHLRLINNMARAAADLHLPSDSEHSAHRFHRDLFLSGIEKIIATARKASSVYYPTLHLELSRYMNLALATSGLAIPWGLKRYVGSPPVGVGKTTPPATRGSSRSASPARVHGAAMAKVRIAGSNATGGAVVVATSTTAAVISSSAVSGAGKRSSVVVSDAAGAFVLPPTPKMDEIKL